MSKSLQIMAEYAKNETGRNAASTASGPHHSEPDKEVRQMADASQYSDSIALINQEHSDNWKPIGVVVARLIGGAK